jgi:predicted GNAT family acetyltransferase
MKPLSNTDAPSPIPVVHNAAAQRFEAQIEGHLAFAEYRVTERAGTPVMVMFHTESPAALQGRGVAAALVKAALAHALAHSWKVDPQCSYVAAYMDRHPETQLLRA